jgi:hypothetical protein
MTDLTATHVAELTHRIGELERIVAKAIEQLSAIERRVQSIEERDDTDLEPSRGGQS